MTTPIYLEQLARDFHEALPSRIRFYLKKRGISDDVIDRYELGWNGDRITIPIRGRGGDLAFFKFAKDPAEEGDAPKMLTPRGVEAELYGWDALLAKPSRVIISEGEFDRLVLETQGFAALTSTGGAGCIRREWAEALKGIAEVFICFDRDDAGKRGAERVAAMIPHAKVVELPEEVGVGGDVTDFFVRLERSTADFEALLQRARRPPPEAVQKSRIQRSGLTSSNLAERIRRIKDTHNLSEVVSDYIALKPTGRCLMGLCPFHDDTRPSFAVYANTKSFHCFGCGRHGDVITFVQEIRKLGFRDTVDLLDPKISKTDGAAKEEAA